MTRQPSSFNPVDVTTALEELGFRIFEGGAGFVVFVHADPRKSLVLDFTQETMTQDYLIDELEGIGEDAQPLIDALNRRSDHAKG